VTSTNEPAALPPAYAYVLGDALYLNLTSACTLACVFCPKIRDDDWVVGGWDLRLARPPSADEAWAQVLAAGVSGRPEVVFTGLGEPTRRLDVLLDLTRRLKAAGVARVRLDTDGLANLREGRDVTPDLAAAGLDAAVVSLNAPDGATYARLCPNRFGEAAWQAARDFIRAALRHVPEVHASFVAVPGLDEAACRREAESLGARFRWRPYDRVGRLREAGGSA
jgi:TatD family-associated radical SAM protein